MASPHFSADVRGALEQRTATVDAIAAAAFVIHLAPEFPSGIALVAVGGFGRRELFPHSDIDLLILVEREVNGDSRRAALSAFLRALWDAGLRLSQSVRTVSQCCSFDPQNVELAISLLDQRFLGGDVSQHQELARKLPPFFSAHRNAITRGLLALTQARHSRFQQTIYHLEPDVKETPGALRDVHVVDWLRRLRGEDPAHEQPLEEAFSFIASVRSHLHQKLGRDANVLSFAAQEELAPDPAAWMREYFRHARTISRTAAREIEAAEPRAEGALLRQFRDWRARLSNQEFTVAHDKLLLRSPAALGSDPGLVMRLFAFVARHGVQPAADTQRRIADVLPAFRSWLRSAPDLWPQLTSMLTLPHAPAALRAMHDSGALFELLPEWRDIDCLVVRDFYHRYTVDEHSLIAVEVLAALPSAEAPGHRRFAELCSETDRVPLLALALLFHDAGKAQGVEGHSWRSASMAEAALKRLRAPVADVRTVSFLVNQHLVLSSVMLGRDINDPSVIRDLAHRVGTIENLKLLTLMTYADISAVNPAAMTPWRLEQLWRLYLHTYNELTRELETDRIGHVQAEGEHQAFLEGLPVRYMRVHSEAEIRRHAELAAQCATSGVAAALERQAGVWLLTVAATDKPGIFAAIAGALAGFGMNILKAEAFGNAAGIIIDTFVFADPMRTLELNPAEVDRLKLTVQRAVTGRDDVRRLLNGRKRAFHLPPSACTPSVAFNADASDHATLVEIVAADRPGLLFDLASAFTAAGCNIDVVLIDTESHKAIDVFYVNRDGRKLDPATEQALKQELLRICSAS